MSDELSESFREASSPGCIHPQNSSHQFKFLYSSSGLELSHLVADHDVGDLGLAVHVLMFLLIGEN